MIVSTAQNAVSCSYTTPTTVSKRTQSAHLVQSATWIPYKGLSKIQVPLKPLLQERLHSGSLRPDVYYLCFMPNTKEVPVDSVSKESSITRVTVSKHNDHLLAIYQIQNRSFVIYVDDMRPVRYCKNKQVWKKATCKMGFASPWHQ